MNALGRAAAQVRADLDRYRIEVRPDEMVTKQALWVSNIGGGK